MNTTNERDLFIDRCVTAARDTVDGAEIAAATARFRDSLPAPKRARSGLAGLFPGWLRVGGAVAGLALAVSLVPLLLPGEPSGTAFAQVRAWFEDYRTLHVVMTTRQDGRTLTTLQVWTDETGATRVEVPPVVHLIDPARGALHTVLPGGQMMSRSLGMNGDTDVLGDRLEWLDELRHFQGMAERLEASRSIEGVAATGWRLELAGSTHTLWTDPADHRPLLLVADLPGEVTMETRFHFNQAFPEGLFDLPAGQ